MQPTHTSEISAPPVRSPKSDAAAPDGVAPDEEALFREFQAYVRAIYLEANKTVIKQLEHIVTTHSAALAEHRVSTVQTLQAHATAMNGLTRAAKDHTAAHDGLAKDLKSSSSELLQGLDAMAKYQATRLNCVEKAVADLVKVADERHTALRGLISQFFIGAVVLNIVVGVLVYLLATQR